jgi:hypothetical protein
MLPVMLSDIEPGIIGIGPRVIGASWRRYRAIAGLSLAGSAGAVVRGLLEQAPSQSRADQLSPISVSQSRGAIPLHPRLEPVFAGGPALPRRGGIADDAGGAVGYQTLGAVASDRRGVAAACSCCSISSSLRTPFSIAFLRWNGSSLMR